jgi:hypothetical protein
MKMATSVQDSIEQYGDWRTDRLRELRQLINQAGPELTEELKWDVPVWSHNGLVCAISGFKDHVKINFFKGAYLTDSRGVFNNGAESKEHRSIDIKAGETIPRVAITNLIKAAVALNNEKHDRPF